MTESPVKPKKSSTAWFGEGDLSSIKLKVQLEPFVKHTNYAYMELEAEDEMIWLNREQIISFGWYDDIFNEFQSSAQRKQSITVEMIDS